MKITLSLRFEPGWVGSVQWWLALRLKSNHVMKKVNRGPRKPVDLSTVRRSSRVGDKPPQASGRP
nr:B3 domain-containing protein At3g19184-like [Tanacetum cinerariifolium]